MTRTSAWTTALVGWVSALSLGAGCGGIDEPVEESSGQALKAICGGVRRNLASDNHHCGACGHDCLGASCISGACQVIALARVDDGSVNNTTHAANSLAVDANNVYWTYYNRSNNYPYVHHNQGWVAKVSIGGGARSTVAGIGAEPMGLAVDATHVYFSTQTYSPWSTSVSLNRASIGGGQLVQIGSTSLSSSIAEDGKTVSLVGDWVYWNVGGRWLMTTPKSGGTTSKKLAAAVSINVAFNHAADHSYLWWEWNAQYPVLGRMAPNGTQSWLDLGGVEGALLLEADAQKIYWANDTGVYSMPTTGATLPLRLAGSSGGVNCTALDDKSFYWSEEANGHDRIRKIGRNGSTPTTVATLQEACVSMAIDSKAIYVGSSDWIWKVAK